MGHISVMDILENKWFGDLCSFLGALTAFFLCMILPLVGRAGMATVHATQNYVTFLGVLLLAIAFSALGWWSKTRRRKSDQSPYPWVSAGLTCFYLTGLVILLMGGLKI